MVSKFDWSGTKRSLDAIRDLQETVDRRNHDCHLSENDSCRGCAFQTDDDGRITKMFNEGCDMHKVGNKVRCVECGEEGRHVCPAYN
jgi:hypothetical protein